MIYGATPTLKHIRVWGSIGGATQSRYKPGLLLGRAVALVGYGDFLPWSSEDGYRVFDGKTVFTSRDVRFDEWPLVHKRPNLVNVGESVRSSPVFVAKVPGQAIVSKHCKSHLEEEQDLNDLNTLNETRPPAVISSNTNEAVVLEDSTTLNPMDVDTTLTEHSSFDPFEEVTAANIPITQDKRFADFYSNTDVDPIALSSEQDSCWEPKNVQEAL